MPQNRLEREQTMVAEWAPNPTVRVGQVDDIANTVAFIASPKAAYIHGANIRVDGSFVPTVN
jgi:NAD(P)-dependent dehydrogenase (short-subunit alcohol dehydrogenase family)